ncbi:MAG: hypothetical protein LH631_03285 [Alkalinema sp. CAN_BIN05]|nr:hypothetical protein [Alkalinema sp. CAN_BIN05]
MIGPTIGSNVVLFERQRTAIAAQFKGTAKQKATIPDCLESLEILGIIAHHTENGTDRYYLAELQKAG